MGEKEFEEEFKKRFGFDRKEYTECKKCGNCLVSCPKCQEMFCPECDQL